MAPKVPEEPGEDATISGCDGEDDESPVLPETVALLTPVSPNITPPSDSTWPPPSPRVPIARPSAHGSSSTPDTAEAEPSGASSFFSSKKIIRWVGVHGGQASEEVPGSSNAPATPTTPHIVVSTSKDDTANTKNNTDKSQFDTPSQQLNASSSNGQVLNNPSTPAPPPTPANNAEEKKLRLERLSLNTTMLEFHEGRRQSLDFNMYRKTRRNSMNEMFRRIGGSQTNLQGNSLPSANNIRHFSSRNSLVPSVVDWKQEGNDSLIACLSALYGKLLVVMGMAFPIAEVISHDIPISFYNGFYLYLYIGSIIFLVYAYVFLLRSLNLPTEHLKSKFQSLRSYMAIPDLNVVFPRRNTSQLEGTGDLTRGQVRERAREQSCEREWVSEQETKRMREIKIQGRMSRRDSRVSGCSDVDKESDRASVNTMSFKPPKFAITGSNNHGSMYLKMGAVVFGIGSMIYSGLEVGQYFELKADDDCANVLLVVSPAARMLFTFIQMYFIFLNSRVAISRHRIIARFGLMHMIGTNLCIWLNVLVQETKHEIINLTLGHGHHGGGNLWLQVIGASHPKTPAHHEDNHGDLKAVLGHHADEPHDIMDDNTLHHVINDSHHIPHVPDLNAVHLASGSGDNHKIVRRSSNDGAFSIYECRRSQLMGQLVDNASPFLFPCTIEYSLLCAGVLYVIWKNINKPEVAYDGDSDISTYVARKARHHYSVDCAHANRGLFMGILVLVLTIISLILFFVLINNEDYKSLAILEASIIELSVYGVATVTVVIGMIQMRELEFVPDGEIELDNILLLIAQTGVYIYTSFTVIGGHFTLRDHMVLPLLSAIITLIQTTLQTIFILDATRRCCYNHEQLERKPGREMVTFLLVCNLAMWAINTFETSRADAHPTQLNFYGIWAWTIISHVSMPLAIFYRFHVTVCLCEIWKRSYKLKSDF
nr:proton channel OtopLc-like isoform X1 [Cherax quadricarinatus]